MTALIQCPYGMGCVFYYRDSITLANGINCVEVGGGASIMYWNNGFGSWGNSSFNLLRCHHKRIAVDIDHDGRRTQQDNHVEGRNPRHRRRNDLVACTNAQRHQRNVHSCSGGANGDGMLIPRELAKSLFQLLIFRAGGYPSRVQNRLHCGKFFSAHGRARERQKVRHHYSFKPFNATEVLFLVINRGVVNYFIRLQRLMTEG